MKSVHSILAFTVLTLLFPGFPTPDNSGRKADCLMVTTYAEMAYANFKKAYQSVSTSEAAEYLKKGTAEASQASAYAIMPKCNCNTAKNFALNAVTFAKKAGAAKDLEETKQLSKKAMDAALSAVSAVPGCK